MTRSVAVITVHGMGTTRPDYDRDLRTGLRHALGAAEWERHVHFDPVFYQDLLQRTQGKIWNDMERAHDLRWDNLRRFMLFAFSDAGAIEHSLHTREQSLYLEVHRRIRDAFDRSFAALRTDTTRPVIVVAHSLGGEQVSNYVWDALHGRRLFADDDAPEELRAFRRLASCTALVTTGCNIPVFKAGLPRREIFPRPNETFMWHNLFDQDDVLGYPMRPLGDAFEVEWLQDEVVRVGGIATGWNPLSHSRYWSDGDVIARVAELVRPYLG